MKVKIAQITTAIFLSLATVISLAVPTHAQQVYRLPSQISVVSGGCLQPPIGRDPDTYSNSELGKYGLLARDNLDHNTWKQLVLKATHHSCLNKPIHVSSDSDNWSGNVADAKSYTSVSATWNAPCIQPGGANGYSSFWVGLGGDGNQNLVQAGTESDYSNGHATYFAWIENLVSNPYEAIEFYINCGNTMFSRVNNGNNMYIEDETTGAYYDAAYGPAANASTAEVIAERPTVNGSYAPLADFRWVSFSGCLVQPKGASTEGIGKAPHYYYTMNGRVSVGPISSNGQNFQVNWKSR
jgi:hypothetical protein